MPVLHLCSDFANQNIYTQLVRHLHAAGIQQRVFAAVRSQAEVDRQPADEAPNLLFDIRNVLHPRHRILFGSKIRLTCRTVEQRGWPAYCGLMHAHFLYSDGAAAQRLARRHSVPFITAVRNSDLFTFMKYRPDLWPRAKAVLRDASAVVFLTPAYRDLLLGKLRGRLRDQVQGKAVVIPSGLSGPWLANPAPTRPQTSDLRVLYVGDFSANKNIPSVIRAVELIRSRRPATLTLIGGGGDGEAEVECLLKEGASAFVERHQPIRDPDRLRGVARTHDVFAMPSFRETFGVVYLEALSQGLPIVHSHGQGVAGLLRNGAVSMSVDPSDPTALAAAIEALHANGSALQSQCVAEAARFSWERIAARYARLYADAMHRRTVDTGDWDR
jgi:glycosyltransferase involved in cell wall biosynthesis